MAHLEPILSREEIATLLGDAERHRASPSRMQAIGIDLLAEDRHLRQLIPTLQVGFARLAEALRRVLTSVLRAEVQVSDEPAEVVNGRGMAAIASRASCIVALRMKGSGGPGGGTGGGGTGKGAIAVLALDPVFTFSVIERLFGGGGGPPKMPQGRSPTTLERRMLTRALAPLFDALDTMLEPLGYFAFEVMSVESRLELIAGYAPDTTALHVPFTLAIGTQLASFSLALPSTALEPLRGKLGVPNPDPSNSPEMSRLVAEIPVSVSVVLGHAEMTLRALLRLQPGTVLALSQGRSDELPVTVEGVVKFHGTPVQQDGMVAVEITRREL